MSKCTAVALGDGGGWAPLELIDALLALASPVNIGSDGWNTSRGRGFARIDNGWERGITL